MKTGLLWYDDNPEHDLAEKVGGAVRRYRRKFGLTPDTCYAHPSSLANIGPHRIGPVRVAALPTALRYHFWVGIEE